MDLENILSQVELFQGLNQHDLIGISEIFKELSYSRGDVIAKQGNPGDSLFIVSEGFVEVAVAGQHKGEMIEAGTQQVLINLGKGQIFGEMSLVDLGPRSATVTAISTPTVVQAVMQAEFENFCEENPQIGYVVMRNIAADLSFKLRKQNLAR